MNRSEFQNRWSQLHNNAPITGIVGGWLQISYAAARAANRLRLTPNGLTLLGVIFSIAALSAPQVAVVLIPLSLAMDGIDGSLAIIQNRSSKKGALYDSLADRLSEACWAAIFYLMGAALWAAIAFWMLGAIQEYARARISSLGVSDLGVVTPMERPMRASALFIALVLHLLAFPGSDFVLLAALILQVFSVLLVVRFANRSLQPPSQR